MFSIDFLLLLLHFLNLKVKLPEVSFSLKKNPSIYKMICVEMQSSQCCFTTYSLFTDVVFVCSSFE